MTKVKPQHDPQAAIRDTSWVVDTHLASLDRAESLEFLQWLESFALAEQVKINGPSVVNRGS